MSFGFRADADPVEVKFPVLSFALVNSVSELQTQERDFFTSEGKFVRGGPISLGMPLCLPGGAVMQTSFNSEQLGPNVGDVRVEVPGDPTIAIGPLKQAVEGGRTVLVPDGGTVVGDVTGPFVLGPIGEISFISVDHSFDSVVLVSRVCRCCFDVGGKGKECSCVCWYFL